MKKILSAIALFAATLNGSLSDEIRESQNQGKQVYVLFTKEINSESEKMQYELEQFVDQCQNGVASYSCDITDPDCKDLVKRFDLKRTPMPFIVALAPNDATMGGFAKRVDQEALKGTLLCEGTQKCMKALQDKRLLILCLQNEETSENEEALAGVRAFAEDPRFSQATEIVIADPRKGDLASRFNVDPDMTRATTLLVTPPGNVVTTINGKTAKAEFVDKLTEASSSCCPGGCCPGGCCPGGKCR